MAQAFDTMAYARELHRRGFKAADAMALAETARDHIVERVATKADIADLKAWLAWGLIAAIGTLSGIFAILLTLIK
ncbi:hypothetical protein [Brucella sp. 10RB9213]|uniref:hypothetical protein n=1 Tax=Brucella sp. 10RB9213 TaxID=1844039 RepID=UPI0012AD47A9|nr:hypothetical protein [Brucella sp. 10RB9213]MRN66416.1 hypothetical protein [Brucella sp. 10RB9213]